jgi:DNA-binding beta-propeller fold protein YncE
MTGRTRAAALAVGALALLLCLSSDALAIAGGSLLQQGTTVQAGIAGAGQPAFSPDGQTLYVPGPDDDAVVQFARNASGGLTAAGCISKSGVGCAQVSTLEMPRAAAVSPDGAFLYVAASDTSGTDGRLYIMPRSGGSLGAITCLSATDVPGCTTSPNYVKLGGADMVFARNDSVYVTSASSVYAFRRTESGHTFAGCVGPAAPCTTDNGRFNDPTDVVVAPDGLHAYVSNYNFPDRLVALDRTADGTLTARNDNASCVSFGTLPTCQKRLAGRETVSLALSPDGSQLYATSRYQFGGGDSVELFDLPGDGTITPHAGGCWTSSATPLTGCTPTVGLENNVDIAVAPDGRSAYAGSLDGVDLTASADDGWLVAFGRAADGMLTQLPSPDGCLAPVTRTGCTLLTQGTTINHVVVSPDSRHLYTIGWVGGASHGETRILAFRIEHAPVCASASAQIPYNTPTLLHSTCSDADGDALGYELVTPPQRGTLGGLQADGSVFYSPLTNLSGPDSFQFKAVANGLSSNVATVSLDVAAPPPPPPPPPPGGGGALVRVDVPVRPFWARYPRYLQLRRMTVTKLPATATVEIRCKGKGCPFAKRAVKIRDGKANAAKGFKHAKLRRGTTVQVRILVPGMIGKVVVYTMPKKGFPIGRQRCLPPGATKPAKC